MAMRNDIQGGADIKVDVPNLVIAHNLTTIY